MNKGITYKAIKHRKLTLFMMVVVLVTGLYSYGVLPRQENPDISVPAAQIFVLYPGASPAEMEEFVTDKVEEKIREIAGYDTSKSVTRNGMASIIMMLEDSADIEAAWDDLDDAVRELETQFPSGVTAVQVNTDMLETPGMILSLTGAGYTTEELADYADYYQDKLADIEGVTRFDVYGDTEKEIRIELDYQKLSATGLTLADVSAVLGAENVSLPLGDIDNKTSKVEITVDGLFTQVEEIGNAVLISFDDGRQIRVRDVGTVTYQDNPDTARFERNGQQAVYLAGYFEDSLNVVTVGNTVDAEISRLRASVPEDIQIDAMVFQPEDVRKAVSNFMSNLIQAVVFVIAVVYFGMGPRNAIVVSAVIPLSIAFTMLAMNLMHVKLETMSISGLIIALGMLVDNAIVVSDAIQHHIDQGMERFQAALEGTREVAFSILTSTLTTIFAFMPLLLLNSALGEFVYGVPYVVTVSLFASYLCALITTPVIAGMTFRPSKPEAINKEPRIRRWFTELLEIALKRRRTAIALALAFIVIGFSTTLGMEASLLPKADKTMLQIDLTSEFTSDIQKTRELADQTIALLENEPELTDYDLSVGSNLPKFYMSIQYRSPSPDIAQIAYSFDLSDSKRFKSKESLQAYVQGKLKRELVGGEAATMLLDLGSFSRPIEVRVTGDDIDRLDEASNALKAKLLQIPGAINVEDDLASREYQFQVDVDEVRAGFYGITKADIQRQMSGALMGSAVTDFRKNGELTPIRVVSDIDTKEKLENLSIRSSKNNRSVLLKDIAVIDTKSRFPAINHYEGDRSVTLFADVAKGYSTEAIEKELQAFVAAGDYQDLAFDFEGMMAKVQESNKDIGKLGVFAILMILAVLILQFDSYRQPLIILATIPASIAGALLGLFISRQSLSFVAMLSLVALMGIVVNNAIVLIDGINSLREEGMTVEEACRAAVVRRYRPVTLSTVTTVIGLVPLLVSGGELFRPLAITLMTGLSFGTVITMVMVPTLYVMVMRDEAVIKFRFPRGKSRSNTDTVNEIS